MITKEDRLRRRGKIIACIGLIVGSTLILWFILFHSQLFLVNTIVCSEEHAPCPADVLAELERHRGENIVQIDTASVTAKIEKANADIKQVTISITFPHTLHVFLQRRIPIIQFVRDQQPTSAWVADREGMIVGTGEQQALLPTVVFTREIDLHVGEKLSGQFLVASELIDALKERLDEKVLPFLETNTLIVSLQDGPRVRFSLNKPSAEQLRSLQLLLDQARIGGMRYREIDVRFSQPIVKQ